MRGREGAGVAQHWHHHSPESESKQMHEAPEASVRALEAETLQFDQNSSSQGKKIFSSAWILQWTLCRRLEQSQTLHKYQRDVTNKVGCLSRAIEWLMFQHISFFLVMYSSSRQMVCQDSG